MGQLKGKTVTFFPKMGDAPAILTPEDEARILNMVSLLVLLFHDILLVLLFHDILLFSDILQSYSSMTSYNLTLQWHLTVLLFHDILQPYSSVASNSLTLPWHLTVLLLCDTLQPLLFRYILQSYSSIASLQSYSSVTSLQSYSSVTSYNLTLLWHLTVLLFHQHCKYTTLVDIQKRSGKEKKAKKLVTHVESHASAVSLLESGE